VNLPDGWVISSKPAHEALVSEADFIAAQDVNAARGPAPCGDPAVPQKWRYLLAGLLACATCGRRMESVGSNGKPAYWCRHGRTTAAPPDPGSARNAYVREDRILPRLPALHLDLAGAEPAEARRRRRTRGGIDVRPPASPHLRSGRGSPAGRRQRRKDHRDEGKLTGPKGPTLKGGFRKDRRSPGAGGSPRPGDIGMPGNGRPWGLTCGHAPAGAKRTLSAGFGVGDANLSRQGMKFAGQGGASVGMPTGLLARRGGRYPAYVTVGSCWADTRRAISA
jgi:hypothetical protein